MAELPKTFDPAEIEARWYAHWEGTGAFRPERPDAPPFTIVMPPPNVTGSLHIGHALDITLQDILVRHARLQGKDALWVAGTDHAGIATQMVVERTIAGQGLTRQGLGRKAFLDIVWDWKATSGGAITRQLRRIGASCDWANERFTMDPGFSKAVIKVFVDLYNEGLLYRDKRLVNWDPGLKTAISDLEVETREVRGKFWHLRYPLADGSGHILVATTRPETMLADMAVAVNPGDDRYKKMKDKHVRLPITGRLIPIVADEHADPELGSGAVKITPGHDFDDFEVGLRAKFKPSEMLNMFDADARVIQCGGIPDRLLGVDRFEARARVVEMLEAEGAMERVEDRTIQTPYGDRSGVVIEPWLTDQWYVDAKTLAGPAIEAVRSGAIKVVPETWKKTWFNWLENIQPWCVSRQLWWGHQIPAWYDAKGKAYVAEDEAEARRLAGGKPLTRDPDVLDTWFSSALWPFATLGWPQGDAKALPLEVANLVGVDRAQVLSAEAGLRAASLPSGSKSSRFFELVQGTVDPELPSRREGELLAKHYPNDVLVSGFDILFFWDARMAMQGLHFMKEAPWKTLYLHGLVRAPDGTKMSKSKGNTVDPLGLIDKYGADALRFFMAAMESQGRDIKMDEKRLEGYRNFATKLWNAARFAQANAIGASTTLETPAAELAVNRWIIGEVVETLAKLDKALADFRFDEAANAIYHFVWDRFCDWYLELIKPVLQQVDSPNPNTSSEGEGLETRLVAGWVLDQILVMLHPFMPFITEELWHAMGERPYDLLLARWPEPRVNASQDNSDDVDWLIELVSEIRSMRAELNIAPGVQLEPSLLNASDMTARRLSEYRSTLRRMAKISNPKLLTRDEAHAGGSAQVVVGEATYIFPLADVIDLEAERIRLTKGVEGAAKEADSLAARLANPSFVERAKPEAVAKARADHAEKSAEAERLRAALARLG